ncbi:MAG: DUF4412 domain-containing protein [Verrucomicrobiae bacterium]|nr:DUF4412 domain-containing protein [Verrucomicrobiae bacterium]
MRKLFVLVLSCGLLGAAPALAQSPFGGSPASVNAALTKLFGDIKAFSARAEVKVYGSNQTEKIVAPLEVALLDNKFRTEVDVTQMRNKDLPPGALDGMKQLGMERTISVVRPDKKANYLIFPGAKAYVNLTLPQEELDLYEKSVKVEKSALGKETLDGRACVKHKVLITDPAGRKHEATVWNATDLKDFPVQVLVKEGDDTVIMRYRDIKLGAPDAKLFEPPAGFKEYSDVQALMQALMLKIMSGGGPPQ